MTGNMWRRASDMASSLREWALRGFLALLDQGLISGSNFIVAILLARWLTRSEYGAYALAFEVFLFMSIIYSSLVLEPMSVFGPSLYHQDLRGYMNILLRIHFVISAVFAALAFAAFVVLRRFDPASSLPLACVGVGVAAPCVLLFWLARRGFYVLLNPQKAVWGACAYSAVMLAGLVVVYRLRLLSPLAAFLLMAAGAGIAAPAMLVWFKHHTPSSTVPRLVFNDVLSRHWRYGCWALGSATAIWLSGSIYYPLLGTFFNLGEAGNFKALMNLASPVGQVFVAASLLSLPYASRAEQQSGRRNRNHLAWKLTGLYVAGTSAYWAVLLALRHPIVHRLYGGKYPQVIELLPWLALGSILRIGATSQSIMLRAMNRPDLVFVAYVAACVVTIIGGIPAARWFGIAGAVTIWIVASGVAFVAGAFAVQRRYIQSEPPAAAAPSS